MDYNEEFQQDDIFTQLTETIDGESAQGYAAFLFWANLPASDRFGETSNEKIADNFGLSPATIKSYRTSYAWNDRIKQLDAHFARLQFNQRVEANKEHNLKFAEEARKIQTDALAVSRQALLVCKNLLDSAALANKPIETDWVLAKQSDGSFKRLPRTTTIVMEARVGDVAPLLRAAVDVPTKIAGLPVEAVPMESQTMLGNGVPRTKAEIEERRKKLQKERAKIIGVEHHSDKIN